jgi:predicted amidophosphoribosyltransferase
MEDTVAKLQSISKKLNNISQKLDGTGVVGEESPSVDAEIDCPNCQKAIPSGSAFCEHCGQKLP